MIHIGLTGGIASGKSTVCRMFSRLGVSIFDADATVRMLYGRPDVVNWFIKVAPHVVRNATIDRYALSVALYHNPALLHEIEAMIHPLIWVEEQRFIRAHRLSGSRVIISDIPLLFETGKTQCYDSILLIAAPLWLRKRRALKRSGMTHDKLALILANQWDEGWKKHHADAVITTSAGCEHTARQVAQVHMQALGAMK